LKEENILSLEEHQTLFGTIEAILPTNFHLLEELQHVIVHWHSNSASNSVGNIFLKLVCIFASSHSLARSLSLSLVVVVVVVALSLCLPFLLVTLYQFEFEFDALLTQLILVGTLFQSLQVVLFHSRTANRVVATIDCRE
jgi:ABC-type glycerol-3-phosphate transport system permease component